MSVRAIILAAPLALVAASAGAAEGSWGNGIKAAVRLVAAGVDAEGRLIGGIEIEMPPGWHTYWRTPGDAGIAPDFDFSGSTNLDGIEVAFPVPTRLDDGVNVSNVYNDRVMLPVTATVVDPGAPSTLSVAIELGVCAEVCVPDSIAARLDLPAGETDVAAARLIAEALARVPGPLQPGVFEVVDASREGGTEKRPVFRFMAVVPKSDEAEIFVEGPENWAPYRPERVAEAEAGVAWTVKFSRLGARVGAADATFRVTIVSGGRAIEQTISAN